MKTKKSVRMLGFLLAFCMLISVLPPAVKAEEEALSVPQEEAQTEITYSELSLSFDQTDTVLPETLGEKTVTLRRGGDVSQTAEATVLVYDNSANYGEDYRICYLGEAVEKLDGATSIYDAFRDGGELNEGWELTEDAEALAQSESEAVQSVSAAEMLEQLNELNVLAARIPVRFEAGVATVTLAVEPIDDALSEYEESFLLIALDAQGNVAENAQLLLAIEDNEASPTVTVFFDCGEKPVADADTGLAALTLRRAGNLATATSAVLMLDGEAYGYVDFAPYQEYQLVYAEAGEYSLAAGTDYGVTDESVTVASTDGSVTVPKGGDPELDAVPNAYASMGAQKTKAWSAPSWFPAWAKNTGTVETTDSISYMGTTSKNLFAHYRISGVGSHDWFQDGGNMHSLDTSGTFSRMKTGYVNVRTTSKYDMTGIASVETTGYVTGLDYSNKVVIALNTGSSELGRNAVSNSKNNASVTTSYTLPDKYQGSVYVHVENTDPSSTDDGCALYIPNGFKCNKRTYRFEICDPEPLYYRGVGEVSITAQKESGTIFAKMGDSTQITIAYMVEGDYPVKLTGFRLKNLSNGTLSEEIVPVDGNTFAFTKSFLKSYEASYCVNTQYSADGKSYPTFGIVPVFEKIPVNVQIEDSLLGTITIRNYTEGEPLYVGESIVLDGECANDGAAFYGVYYKCYKNLSSDICTSGTVNASSSGAVTYEIGKFDTIVLQGSFSATADRLVVQYTESDSSKRHGKLGFAEGVVVQPEEYIINEFFPLVAIPDDGYVTRWYSDGRVYYGNTFYYQLDGDPNHNSIRVEFIAKDRLETKTAALNGTLFVYDAELRTNGRSQKLLTEKQYTVSSDKLYSGVSDADGKFTVESFTAVVGGTYSMMVLYRDMVGYVNFVPFPDAEATGTVELCLPQFAAGSVYPSRIDITLGYVTSGQNVVQVRPTDTGSITVQITNAALGSTIRSVTLHFLSTAAKDYGSELTTIEMKYNERLTEENDAGLYSYWTAEITDSGVLPVQSRMYVSVEAEKEVSVAEVTTDGSGNVTGTTVGTAQKLLTSGLVNTGYELISAIIDTSIAVQESIPDLPGAQNAYSVDTAALNIPIIGSADFSLTSPTGGYFVQKVVNGTTYLICGYSITPVYGVSTVQDKFDKAMQTRSALAAAQASDAKQKAGDAEMLNILLGKGNSGGANTAKTQTAQKKPSKWALYPAFMFKFALTPGVDADGESKVYVTGFEIALGFDLNYLQNIPFSFSGIPFYLCFTTQIEAVSQGQFAMEPGTVEQGSDKTMTLYEMCQMPGATENAVTSGQNFVAVPKLSLGLKAGVGYNTFFSFYVNGTVEMPMIFQFRPYFDAAGKFGFSISAGADLVFFTANYKLVNVSTKFGSEELYGELSTIQGFSASAKRSAEDAHVLSDGEETPTLEEMLNQLTFSMMERPENGSKLLRTHSADSATLAENVFKNTGVQLVKLDNGNIMALFLTDNGEEGYNYLTAAYAVSADNGLTWSDIRYVNSNIGQANTALQFDINVFQLEDRMLVTWSEADFNTLLKDVDADNLSIAQIASLMNAMNLRGRFFDPVTGEAMGEAFTIAEHSTVACGALDAVQNGENVYVYYQRNAFPTGEDTELSDLMSNERTVALARANVNTPSEWTSTSVRALNENGQQYRITEVEPFVHDGVMGELLVIDRNGKLATYDEEEEEWTADNEDRQIFLRTYDFAEDGTPQPTALLPLTDADDCAQSPQVVSNDEYLHLFWNENGEVVYFTDFVATDADHSDVQAAALLLRESDGSVTVNREESAGGSRIVGSESLTVGTKFSVSMADDGNVLLSWVADDAEDESLVPTDEIYGVILHTVTNAEALALGEKGSTDDTGNENVYQLWAVGAPVALTQEDGLVGALDSICMESGSASKFLLAYTRLNAAVRTEATSADLIAVQSVDAPELVLEDISVPTAYPLPDSELTVRVTATNYGLEPLYGASFTVDGLGETVRMDYDAAILPARSATVDLTVPVPADFAQDTELTVTVRGLSEQSAYSDSGTVQLRYGPYFAIDAMSDLIAVPNSTDCEAVTRVKNIGNAAGCPTLCFTNTIFGSDEDCLEYRFESDTPIGVGEEAAVTYVLTDTLMNTDKTANLVVSVGANYDQSADSLMPVPVIETPELTDNTPTEPDQPAKPIEQVFSDVKNHWAKDDIAVVYQNGLMNGMSASTFEPETEVTRAMLATVLYRMAGSPKVSGASPFEDVKAGQWYTDAVIWAAANGIVKGCGDGKFLPDALATREQTATMLYRYARFAGCDMTQSAALSTFRDGAEVADYAAEPMRWAIGAGLIKGMTADTLCPRESATRAQLAALLRRFETIKT